MKLTTICYIERDEKYLMLHRTKKKNDMNTGKWLGIGGKFEDNETPEECVEREVKEETGLTLKSYKLRGIVTYISNQYETEYMYIFTSNDFKGELIECNEGDLEWIPIKEIFNLNMWEGDPIFLKELRENDKFFTIKYIYEGDNLLKYELKTY